MGYSPRVLEVQTSTHLPANLLPREQSQIIYDMIHEGCTLDEIYAEQLAFMRITDRSSRPVQARQRIDEFMLNRWRYNPDIDEVAVERAFDGDREVWVNLTHYERVEVLQRLRAIFLSPNGVHRKWPDAEESHGIREWAESVGESHQRVTKRGKAYLAGRSRA